MPCFGDDNSHQKTLYRSNTTGKNMYVKENLDLSSCEITTVIVKEEQPELQQS